MKTRYSSAAYRELGRLLCQTRRKAGLSSEKLAKKLGWPLTTISRMENGGRRSSTTDVIQYAVMCGLRTRALEPLVEFTRLCEREQSYYLSDEAIDGSLQSLIFHESSADSSILYEPQLIHGLLQTPEYARALIAEIDSNATEECVAGAVRTRMERRRILSQANPAQFTFYLDEHALRLRVGTNEIMHEQLLHLVLTAALDNVTVRIVPSTAGERSAFGGAFGLMEFTRHRPIVYLDNLRIGGLILEDSDHVRSYRELVPVLDEVALGEGESRKFAANLADAYDRGSRRGGADGVEEEQLQRRLGNELRGGGVAEEQPQRRFGHGLCGSRVESPTPIYE